ncbi:MAG: hypothetical protein IPK10_03170 [Bacteroidetes bacterium]|nr:hypothetical protein [Bacteroidota bacterium]
MGLLLHIVPLGMLKKVVRFGLIHFLLLLMVPALSLKAQFGTVKVVPQIADRFEYPFYKESFDSVAKG